VIYDVQHVTTYQYEAPVRFAQCVLRLSPVDRPGQRVVSSQLMLTPRPADIRERLCFFGNRTSHIIIEETHHKLRCEIHSRIEINRIALGKNIASQSWEDVREDAYGFASLAPDSPAHYIYPSRRAPRVFDIETYGRLSFAPGRPMLQSVVELMGRIKADFVYDPTATEVSTPIIDAFAQKRGVCQDFAHIMIGAVRGLGLPASYVSGYLRTVPPPGKPRLEGADAMHAWIEVWCGHQFGWVGFDPTNDLIVGEDHIVLAIGRDYGDVSPIKGMLLGAGDQTLDTEVDVIPVIGS
jgi:transglutaminase-like putative cysteine protease